MGVRVVIIAAACLLAGGAGCSPDGRADIAPQYMPPIEREPPSSPQAYFVKELRGAKWCAVDEASARRRAESEELDPSEVGWIRFDAGGLHSITVETQSEDALASDLYTFAADGRVVRLVRTGGYINSPPASLVYQPNPSGTLTLTPKSREVIDHMDRAGHFHYIEAWPTYSRLNELPFAKLIDLTRGVRVRMGACV